MWDLGRWKILKSGTLKSGTSSQNVFLLHVIHKSVNWHFNFELKQLHAPFTQNPVKVTTTGSEALYPNPTRRTDRYVRQREVRYFCKCAYIEIEIATSE